MFTLRLFKLKRHSRRVLLFKRGLPVFAFLLASLMLVWPTLFAEQKEQFSIAVKSDKKHLGARVDMEGVRFYARDKKNQPLVVTAPKVLETDPDKQIVTLYKPVAEYGMASGTTLTAQTAYGLAYQTEEYILFEDEVVATTDTGYKAVSKQVICDNKAGQIRSDSPVTVTGPTGHLTAEGFRIYNKGDAIDFLKKTNTTLFSDKGEVHITSKDGLMIDQPQQKITALKDVVVTHQDKTVRGDKIVLIYNTKDQDAANRIRSIEAFGHVVAQNPTNKVTGNHGVYDPKTGTIVMSDNVVLYQGASHLDGDKAVVDLNTGASTLTPKKQATQKPARIRGRLNPDDFKGGKQ